MVHLSIYFEKRKHYFITKHWVNCFRAHEIRDEKCFFLYFANSRNKYNLHISIRNRLSEFYSTKRRRLLKSTTPSNYPYGIKLHEKRLLCTKDTTQQQHETGWKSKATVWPPLLLVISSVLLCPFLLVNIWVAQLGHPATRQCRETFSV